VRITVLTYVEKENSREVDPVVRQVTAALRKRKHSVSVFPIHGDVKKVVSGLARRKPDLVFNLVEMFGDNYAGDAPVAGLLDLLGYRYTGSGPGELYLSIDKVLSKRLLAFDGILFPRFAVFSREKDFHTGGNLRLPLFVKPVSMDASIGIGKKSLVSTTTEMMQRVLAIHRDYEDAALAEEFIEGREFYVGVLGNNGDAQAFPPIEADFSGLPEGAPKVYDRAAKWEPGSKEYAGTKTKIAEIPEELRARLQRVSLDAYRALRVKDYGRVDLRVAETGEIYVLEVNASCYLEKADEFSVAARAAGIEHAELINRIVDLAMARYGK
jgi:D-alanine-D-alanine ligase